MFHVDLPTDTRHIGIII